ncbi:MAG TPA: hypothetical protein VFD82_18580 [Planctomycetota bacterium]|nr:hypothetical protein [Planctomycetota bacterium]
MNAMLWLMASQGTMGAFDTLYYHEYRARLPAGGTRTRLELVLHALRDFVYAVLFGTLPWWSWSGSWAYLLAVLLATEIALTLADFVIEIEARKPGDVFAGERVTHGLMAIVYGAFLACLLPRLLEWRNGPTCFMPVQCDAPFLLRVALGLMAAGVFASGLRDLYAALGFPRGTFPWEPARDRK